MRKDFTKRMVYEYRSSISFSQYHVDSLQVSLLINKQTGGKQKKERERKREGERDLWPTRSENEAWHSPAQV